MSATNCINIRVMVSLKCLPELVKLSPFCRWLFPINWCAQEDVEWFSIFILTLPQFSFISSISAPFHPFHNNRHARGVLGSSYTARVQYLRLKRWNYMLLFLFLCRFSLPSTHPSLQKTLWLAIFYSISRHSHFLFSFCSLYTLFWRSWRSFGA